MRKLLAAFLLCSCQASPLENVGVRLRPIYERHVSEWSKKNSGPTNDSAPSWYRATFRHREGLIPGKLSIRGDLSRHWKNDEKSYKFKADTGASFQGLREFDLIVADDKNYELEALGLELAKSLGLLTPRWQFVNFSLNHRDHGTYLLLERWTPESMETRGLPEGEIIRENNAWLDVLRLGKASRYKDVFADRNGVNPLAYRPEIYRATFHNAFTPSALARFSMHLGALEAGNWQEYIEQRDAINWVILMSVLGSYHGALGDNMKWYYHPYKRKFSPIPYDFLPEAVSSHSCVITDLAKMNPWVKIWLEDPTFRNELELRFTELRKSNWPERIIEHFYATPAIKLIAGMGTAGRRLIIEKNVEHLGSSIRRSRCP